MGFFYRLVRIFCEETMNQGKELIKLDDPQNIIEFLQQPATKLAEFITGVLVSDSKDWKLSAGHLIQASIKWKLFSQLGKEIKDYIEKGKIKENYLENETSKQSLSELLKFIDETAPDVTFRMPMNHATINIGFVMNLKTPSL